MTAYFKKGNLEQATAFYQKSVDLDPDHADAQNNLGVVLMQKGLLDESIVHLQKAIELDPLLAKAHFDLAVALAHGGQLDGAIVQFQKALEIQPHNPETQYNLAYLLAACPQASLRDGTKAVALALQANQSTSGTNPMILGTLAAAYAEAGRFPEAEETAQKALALVNSPSDAALADMFRSQIALYKAHTPFRDSNLGK